MRVIDLFCGVAVQYSIYYGDLWKSMDYKHTLPKPPVIPERDL